MHRRLFATVLTLGLLTATAAIAAPRTVEIGLYLTDIAAIDERAETYVAEFDVISRWNDPARAFTPTAGEELPRLYVGAAATDFVTTS